MKTEKNKCIVWLKRNQSTTALRTPRSCAKFIELAPSSTQGGVHAQQASVSAATSGCAEMSRVREELPGRRGNVEVCLRSGSNIVLETKTLPPWTGATSFSQPMKFNAIPVVHQSDITSWRLTWEPHPPTPPSPFPSQAHLPIPWGLPVVLSQSAPCALQAHLNDIMEPPGVPLSLFLFAP